MPAYRDDTQSELMDFLLHQRERFDSQEEFDAFVLSEVRRFIFDLRLMDIELTLRPNFGGARVPNQTVTKKSANVD